MPTSQLLIPANFGKLVTIKPPDPAVGTNFNFAVPVNVMILPTSVSFVFVTAAGGGTRSVLLATFDGGDNVFITNSTYLHIGGVNRQYIAQAGGNMKDSASGFGFQSLNISSLQYMRFGDSFVSAIEGIQAGDQISNLKIRYMQWIQE